MSDNRSDGKMVQEIYAEMQKGYNNNQAELVVINNGRLDPEWIELNASINR